MHLNHFFCFLATLLLVATGCGESNPSQSRSETTNPTATAKIQLNWKQNLNTAASIKL